MESIVNPVIEKVKAEITAQMEKALREAESVIEKRYLEVSREGERRINEIMEKSRERIEGEKARLDIDMKRSVNQEKEYWLEKTMERTMKKVDEFTNSKEYYSSLASIIEREARNGAEIRCNPKDEEFIINKLKSTGISGKVVVDKTMKGGIVIYYPDMEMSKDYSLDSFMNQIFDSYKTKIADILFGE